MPPVAAAFAAVGAGAATIAQVATVVSAVGTGLSVVGAVTGNKKLLKIGGTMALAGGITSLATGALGAGAAATTAEGVAGEALGGAGGAMGQAADYGMGAASGYAGEAANVATKGLSDVASNASGMINSPSNNSLYQQYSSDAKTPGGVTADEALTKSSPMNISSGSQFGSIAPPPDTSTFSIKQWFDKLDPRTQTAVLQGTAGAVGGLFQGWTEEQRQALERDRLSLQQNQYNRGMINASSQPVLNFAPTGLIGTRRT